MIYSSPEFFVFFAIVGLLYALAGSHRVRFLILLVSSLFFYLWTGLEDTALFLVVVVGSWLAVWCSERWPRGKRIFISSGISLMLLHLFFWKYAAWFFTSLGAPLGLTPPRWLLELPLPVGISFFTLQGVAYLIDYSRGEASYIRLGTYTLFKAFFGQLIAGPIVRVPHLLPQLQKLVRPTYADAAEGLTLFAVGFLKKTLVADSIAPFVDKVFSTPSAYDRFTLFLAALCYTAQIWADFSGYTDMGRGAARCLGISLPQNFLAPYLAKSPSEFWKRWHITLSEWIRDYLYIPLGGRKGSLARRSLVVMSTMGIAGLWHGASWNFLIWGFLHGALLLIERSLVGAQIFLTKRGYSVGMPPVLKILLTQSAVVIGWIFFRAETFEQAMDFLSGLVSSQGTLASPFIGRAILALTLVTVFHAVFYWSFTSRGYPVLEYFKKLTSNLIVSVKTHPWAVSSVGFLLGLSAGALYYLCLFLRILGDSRHFIYFRF